MKYLIVLVMAMFIAACDLSPEATQTADVAKAPVKTTRGHVFEYGIYSAQRKGRVQGSLTTNTGKIVTRPVLELSEKTDRIPLIKNTYFAYRYRITDIPKEEAKKPTVDVRKVLTHPEMTLPDGSKSNGWDRVARGRTSVGQVIAFDGYVFSEDYELVEGEWTFQIWFGGQKLVEQKFTTYQPEKLNADVKADAPAAAVSTAENKI
jgi:hypothetical protein